VHPTKRHPGGPAALYVPYDDVPEYTCSVDAALELVAEKLPEWTWSVGNLRNGGQAYLMRAKGAQLIGGPAATPALALIAAMLEALIGRIEDE
jgi:hypothetical protein